MIHKLILFTLSIVLFSSGALAQVGQRPVQPGEKSAGLGERYALLVGVREYDKNELRELPYSEGDVVALAQVFRESGYRPENVVLMTQTVGAKQTRFLPLGANILKELQLLLTNRNEKDSVLVVLAGHGVQYQGDDEQYFCPADARLENKQTLVSLKKIYEALEQSKAGFKLLLVDACRNNPQSDHSRASPTVKLESRTLPAKLAPPGGVAALFSCSAGEKAFESPDLKHGVFFHFVLQGLRGEADLDHDRTVSLPELQQYAMKRVPDYVRAEYGVIQTPDLRGDARSTAAIVRLDAARSSQTPKTALRFTAQSIAGRQVVQKTLELFEQFHYSRRKLDDELAGKWMENMLNWFDGGKLTYLKSDVERFRGMSAGLAGKARLGDITFAWDMAKTFIDRRAQRFAWVQEFIETPHDWSVEEDVPQVQADWAETEQDARDLWRRQVKWTILGLRAQGLSEPEAVHKASLRYFENFVGGSRSLDDSSVEEGCLTALAYAFDPGSLFYSARALQDQMTTFRNRFVGIGVSMQITDGDVLITGIIPGGPAHRDGQLQKGDRLTAVADGVSVFRTTRDLRLRDVVDMVRGPEGKPVRLQIVPKGKTEPIVVELVRGTVELAGARSQVFTEQGRSEQPVKIGYINLPSLYTARGAFVGQQGDEKGRTSTTDTEAILRDFVKQDVAVAILDLRGNLGGGLKEAIDLPGLFLERGPMVQVRSYDGSKTDQWPQTAQLAWDRPLIVLIDKYSASGPSIVARALQDYRRALVVGDTHSSRSGSIQEIFDIGERIVKGSNPPKLGALKLTKNVFFSPSGRATQGIGCRSDIVLPSFNEHRVDDSKTFGSWKVDDFTPCQFLRTASVTSGMIEDLTTKASQRQSVTEDFLQYASTVEKYAAQLKRPTIPLQEQQYLAYYNDLVKLPEKDEAEIVARDAYFNEVLSIALDLAPSPQWQQHLDAARQQLKDKKYADAVRSLDAAIALDATRLEAHSLRAIAHAGAGDWDKAKSDLKTSGVTSLLAYTTDAQDIKSGEQVLASLKKFDYLFVEDVKGDWVQVVPNNKPEIRGWVQKKHVVPASPTIPKRT